MVEAFRPWDGGTGGWREMRAGQPTNSHNASCLKLSSCVIRCAVHMQYCTKGLQHAKTVIMHDGSQHQQLQPSQSVQWSEPWCGVEDSLT